MILWPDREYICATVNFDSWCRCDGLLAVWETSECLEYHDHAAVLSESRLHFQHSIRQAEPPAFEQEHGIIHWNQPVSKIKVCRLCLRLIYWLLVTWKSICTQVASISQPVALFNMVSGKKNSDFDVMHSRICKVMPHKFTLMKLTLNQPNTFWLIDI